MSKTSIEWTDYSWNPVTGCTPVSEGCQHCYARRMAHRLAGRYGYPEAPHEFDVTLHPERLEEPLHWRKPTRIFVVSMGDLFHENIGILDGTFVRDVFATMALCPQHTFILLTKRPQVAFHLLTEDFADGVEWSMEGLCGEKGWCPPELTWPLPNVWLGVTCENQQHANERIPILLQTPAAVHWVSYEPALGLVNFTNIVVDAIGRDAFRVNSPDLISGVHERHLDWVIAGGETGPGAQPAHPDWFRSARDQCQAAGVPFFFKGMGSWQTVESTPVWSDDHVVFLDGRSVPFNFTNFTNGVLMRRTRGKGSRLLDGRLWEEWPHG